MAPGHPKKTRAPPAGIVGNRSSVNGTLGRPLVRRLLDHWQGLALDEAESSRRDWIRSHQVTWERQPHYEWRGASSVRTGYDVALFARHPDPNRSDPGCPECLRIHQELRRLAEDAVGQVPATCALAISPRRPAFAIRPEANWAPEVELDLTVFQPGGVTPSDADEAQVVAALEDGLRRLGARQGAWSCGR